VAGTAYPPTDAAGLKLRPDRVRPEAVEPSTVGRVGELRLKYERQEGRTIVAASRCTSPWHYLPPIYLDDTGAAHTLLVNPSGGLVGGDRLWVTATLGTEARALISTPSANRVYRSAVEESLQRVELSVGPGAVLEWVPEPTIPFAGSRFRQAIDVRLAPGAIILLWDALASGRIARGERWQFASLENEIRITTAAGASVLERYRLAPGEGADGVGLVGEWDYVGSLHLVGDAVGAEAWQTLEDTIAAMLDLHPGVVLGGVSTPAVPGLAVKLVARSAPDLTCILETLWTAIRSQLWALPPPALRRY
jgi:urease accessory protein